MTGPAAPSTTSRWWTTRPSRDDTPPLTARQAYLEVLGVFGVFFAAGIASAAFTAAGDLPARTAIAWRDAIPGAIDQLAGIALCITLPVLLVRRRWLTTVDLGLNTKRPNIPASQSIRIAA